MSRPVTYPGTHRHTKPGFKEPIMLILGQAPRLSPSAWWAKVQRRRRENVFASFCIEDPHLAQRRGRCGTTALSDAQDALMLDKLWWSATS